MMTYPEDEIENQLTGELSHDLTIGDSNQFHKSHIHRGKSIFIFKNKRVLNCKRTLLKANEKVYMRLRIDLSSPIH
jgi:hypothetical protein